MSAMALRSLPDPAPPAFHISAAPPLLGTTQPRPLLLGTTQRIDVFTKRTARHFVFFGQSFVLCDDERGDLGIAFHHR
jgi:hypothetical protein